MGSEHSQPAPESFIPGSFNPFDVPLREYAPPTLLERAKASIYAPSDIEEARVDHLSSRKEMEKRFYANSINEPSTSAFFKSITSLSEQVINSPSVSGEVNAFPPEKVIDSPSVSGEVNAFPPEKVIDSSSMSGEVNAFPPEKVIDSSSVSGEVNAFPPEKVIDSPSASGEVNAFPPEKVIDSPSVSGEFISDSKWLRELVEDLAEQALVECDDDESWWASNDHSEPQRSWTFYVCEVEEKRSQSSVRDAPNTASDVVFFSGRDVLTDAGFYINDLGRVSYSLRRETMTIRESLTVNPNILFLFHNGFTLSQERFIDTVLREVFFIVHHVKTQFLEHARKRLTHPDERTETIADQAFESPSMPIHHIDEDDHKDIEDALQMIHQHANLSQNILFLFRKKRIDSSFRTELGNKVIEQLKRQKYLWHVDKFLDLYQLYRTDEDRFKQLRKASKELERAVERVITNVENFTLKKPTQSDTNRFVHDILHFLEREENHGNNLDDGRWQQINVIRQLYNQASALDAFRNEFGGDFRGNDPRPLMDDYPGSLMEIVRMTGFILAPFRESYQTYSQQLEVIKANKKLLQQTAQQFHRDMNDFRRNAIPNFLRQQNLRQIEELSRQLNVILERVFDRFYYDQRLGFGLIDWAVILRPIQDRLQALVTTTIENRMQIREPADVRNDQHEWDRIKQEFLTGISQRSEEFRRIHDALKSLFKEFRSWFAEHIKPYTKVDFDLHQLRPLAVELPFDPLRQSFEQIAERAFPEGVGENQIDPRERLRVVFASIMFFVEKRFRKAVHDSQNLMIRHLVKWSQAQTTLTILKSLTQSLQLFAKGLVEVDDSPPVQIVVERIRNPILSMIVHPDLMAIVGPELVQVLNDAHPVILHPSAVDLMADLSVQIALGRVESNPLLTSTYGKFLQSNLAVNLKRWMNLVYASYQIIIGIERYLSGRGIPIELEANLGDELEAIRIEYTEIQQTGFDAYVRILQTNQRTRNQFLQDQQYLCGHMIHNLQTIISTLKTYIQRDTLPGVKEIMDGSLSMVQFSFDRNLGFLDSCADIYKRCSSLTVRPRDLMFVNFQADDSPLFGIPCFAELREFGERAWDLQNRQEEIKARKFDLVDINAERARTKQSILSTEDHEWFEYFREFDNDIAQQVRMWEDVEENLETEFTVYRSERIQPHLRSVLEQLQNVLESIRLLIPPESDMDDRRKQMLRIVQDKLASLPKIGLYRFKGELIGFLRHMINDIKPTDPEGVWLHEAVREVYNKQEIALPGTLDQTLIEVVQKRGNNRLPATRPTLDALFRFLVAKTCVHALDTYADGGLDERSTQLIAPCLFWRGFIFRGTRIDFFHARPVLDMSRRAISCAIIEQSNIGDPIIQIPIYLPDGANKRYKMFSDFFSRLFPSMFLESIFSFCPIATYRSMNEWAASSPHAPLVDEKTLAVLVQPKTRLIMLRLVAEWESRAIYSVDEKSHLVGLILLPKGPVINGSIDWFTFSKASCPLLRADHDPLFDSSMTLFPIPSLHDRPSNSNPTSSAIVVPNNRSQSRSSDAQVSSNSLLDFESPHASSLDVEDGSENGDIYSVYNCLTIQYFYDALRATVFVVNINSNVNESLTVNIDSAHTMLQVIGDIKDPIVCRFIADRCAQSQQLQLERYSPDAQTIAAHSYAGLLSNVWQVIEEARPKRAALVQLLTRLFATEQFCSPPEWVRALAGVCSLVANEFPPLLLWGLLCHPEANELVEELARRPDFINEEHPAPLSLPPAPLDEVPCLFHVYINTSAPPLYQIPSIAQRTVPRWDGVGDTVQQAVRENSEVLEWMQTMREKTNVFHFQRICQTFFQHTLDSHLSFVRSGSDVVLFSSIHSFVEEWERATDELWIQWWIPEQFLHDPDTHDQFTRETLLEQQRDTPFLSSVGDLYGSLHPNQRKHLIYFMLMLRAIQNDDKIRLHRLCVEANSYIPLKDQFPTSRLDTNTIFNSGFSEVERLHDTWQTHVVPFFRDTFLLSEVSIVFALVTGMATMDAVDSSDATDFRPLWREYTRLIGPGLIRHTEHITSKEASIQRNLTVDVACSPLSPRYTVLVKFVETGKGRPVHTLHESEHQRHPAGIGNTPWDRHKIPVDIPNAWADGVCKVEIRALGKQPVAHDTLWVSFFRQCWRCKNWLSWNEFVNDTCYFYTYGEHVNAGLEPYLTRTFVPETFREWSVSHICDERSCHHRFSIVLADHENPETVHNATIRTRHSTDIIALKEKYAQTADPDVARRIRALQTDPASDYNGSLETLTFPNTFFGTHVPPPLFCDVSEQTKLAVHVPGKVPPNVWTESVIQPIVEKWMGLHSPERLRALSPRDQVYMRLQRFVHNQVFPKNITDGSDFCLLSQRALALCVDEARQSFFGQMLYVYTQLDHSEMEGMFNELAGVLFSFLSKDTASSDMDTLFSRLRKHRLVVMPLFIETMKRVELFEDSTNAVISRDTFPMDGHKLKRLFESLLDKTTVKHWMCTDFGSDVDDDSPDACYFRWNQIHQLARALEKKQNRTYHEQVLYNQLDPTQTMVNSQGPRWGAMVHTHPFVTTNDAFLIYKDRVSRCFGIKNTLSELSRHIVYPVDTNDISSQPVDASSLDQLSFYDQPVFENTNLLERIREARNQLVWVDPFVYNVQTLSNQGFNYPRVDLINPPGVPPDDQPEREIAPVPNDIMRHVAFNYDNEDLDLDPVIFNDEDVIELQPLEDVQAVGVDRRRLPDAFNVALLQRFIPIFVMGPVPE